MRGQNTLFMIKQILHQTLPEFLSPPDIGEHGATLELLLIAYGTSFRVSKLIYELCALIPKQ